MPRLFRQGFAALAAALSISAAPASAQTPPPVPPVAKVAQGSVQGLRAGDVEAFLGIPYAAPPVGPNRWRAPRPASAWNGLRNGTTFGANCIQPGGQGTYGPWTHEYVVTDNFSEDCLFLNVWKPQSVQAGQKLPVMVWIHGGGFSSGSGAVPIYDGRNLATKGMVVVTINYRVGPLGFLALPELSREAGRNPISNFGIQDQIAALRWIRENIHAFGGDPDRVTIAGQSAGAISVHTLVATPAARGLFQQAIAQSGMALPSMTPDLRSAERTGLEYMKNLGARNLAELRRLPADKLLAGGAGRPLRFGIVVEKRLLPASPAEMVRTGRASDVPMILGQTADDNVGGAPVAALSAADWDKAMSDRFQSHAQAIAALYPAADDAQRARSLRQVKIDRGLAAIWLWAEDRARSARSPVFAYLFTHVEPGPISRQWGSFHSNEIPYVFGTLDKSPERGFTFADWRTSLTISDLWASFIKTGHPSAGGTTEWSALDPRDPHVMQIGEFATLVPLLASERREAYRAYVADGGALSNF